MQKSNALNLTDVVAGYYKPTAASIAFSLALLSQLLGPDPDHILDDPLLQDRVDDALQKANIATSLAFDWDAHQRLDLLKRTDAREVDNTTDRAVSALYNAIDNYRASGPGDPEYDIADNLLQAVMPHGVKVITGKRFEEQFAAVTNLIHRLDTTGKAAVDALNVNHFVEKLRELNDQYGQAITSTGNTGITHSQVQQALTEAQEAFALVILTIWTLYPYEQDRETRNKLLAPIHEQNGRFRQHYARRRSAPLVDPKTGEFTDSDDSALDTMPLTFPTADQDLYPNLPGGVPLENLPFNPSPDA